jgi:hypothetical protein
MSSEFHSSSQAVRDGVARAAAVVGLVGIGLIHLLDLPGKFTGTPYMAWLYVALIVGCMFLAGALIRGSDPRAWFAAGTLAFTVIVGYTLSRTIGLPQSGGDIGNWSEPLGMASLFVEGSVVGVSAMMLFDRARVLELGRRPAEGRVSRLAA